MGQPQTENLPAAHLSMDLQTPLDAIPGLDQRWARQLAKEGIERAEQLTQWLPARHEDRRRQAETGFQPGPQPVCHHVVVTKASVRYYGGGRGRGVFEARVTPAGGSVLEDTMTLRWWNMPFMSRVIVEGMELFIHGRVKEWKGRLSMDHPEYEVAGGDDEEGPGVHTGRITPVYRLKGGITQQAVRSSMWACLRAVTGPLAEDLLPPPKAGGEFEGWSSDRALRALHFPADADELAQARRYLALEEFYLFQLRVARRRRQALDAGGRALTGTGELARGLEAALGFELTGAQRRCLEEIRADMSLGRPMNRLLHGDVGSGKTVVAFLAILHAVESGAQAALMAPTQILAEQHYENARRWLSPLGVEPALLTGSRKESGLLQELRGLAPLVIGTHALLHEKDNLLPDLGLVVIDEQHKFGVAQRAGLIRKGRTPDVLVMTATPIPRTLTLTVYGDLDVSTIDERPVGRGRVVTKVRPASKMAEAAAFLLEQLEQGRQAYLVFPLIEESEKLDAAAVKKGHAQWQKLLPHFTVGLLHGRMSAEEKDSVMRDFRSGKIEVLAATTVIEVGVDVPNATVMFLHNAERYGLAQLHQLRGRIGRGRETSYCVLFVADDDEDARDRLAIMEETSDGFKIAEADLLRRGPGDMLGKAQSGQGALRFAEMLADSRLVRMARTLADRTLDGDPDLRAGRFDRVRATVIEAGFQQAMMQ